MNVLSVISMQENASCVASNHVLVSGSDAYVHKLIFDEIKQKMKGKKTILINFDDTDDYTYATLIRDGFSTVNLLEVHGVFSNPFRDSRSLVGKSNIRSFADCLGYDEPQKAKLIKYVEVMRQIANLKYGANHLLLRDVRELNSNHKFMKALEMLKEEHVISDDYMQDMLSRYLEVCDIAADLENCFLTLDSIVAEDSGIFDELERGTVLLIPFSGLNQDRNLQEIILNLLWHSLKTSHDKSDYMLVVNEAGKCTGKALTKFLAILPSQMSKYVFTEDVFALCSGSEYGISNFLNKFDVHIYTRHNQMFSCAEVEKLAGEIKTIQRTYTKTHDYRLSANSWLDMLLDRDKVESYTTPPPVWEKKFRQEEIASFPKGSCLISYNGIVSFYNLN